MLKKPLLIILDANVIIDAHRENYWNALVNGHRIHLPTIVVKDEAQYFDTGNGKRSINLAPLMSQGLITEITATPEEDFYLQTLVKPSFLPSFDPGEREALALLKGPRCKNFFFCTGDALAIKGLGILGLSTQGASVEKLLEIIGIKKPLKKHFTEEWFQKHLITGFQEKTLWIKTKS
jgi:hypothetical protein